MSKHAFQTQQRLPNTRSNSSQAIVVLCIGTRIGMVSHVLETTKRSVGSECHLHRRNPHHGGFLQNCHVSHRWVPPPATFVCCRTKRSEGCARPRAQRSLTVLSNPTGRFRPIVLCLGLLHVWAKAHRHFVKAWLKNKDDHLIFQGSRDRRAVGTVWRQAVRAEHSGINSEWSITVFQNLQKCCKMVAHAQLWIQACCTR